MPVINIGDFELDENTNGELVIKDQNDVEVVTVDPTAETTSTNSLSTDSATVSGPLSVSNTKIESITKTIADDSVVTVDVTGDALQYVSGDSGSTTGLFLSAFNSLATAAVESNCTNQGNSDLTGTTGPDGSLNVSRVDNTLHVENRKGSSFDVDILTFNR